MAGPYPDSIFPVQFYVPNFVSFKLLLLQEDFCTLHLYTLLKIKSVCDFGLLDDAQEVAGRAAKLRSHGLNFRFRTHVKEPRLIEPKAIWIRKLSVLVALSVFTGIFIASYFVILCDRLAIQSWNRGQASAPTGAPTSV